MSLVLNVRERKLVASARVRWLSVSPIPFRNARNRPTGVVGQHRIVVLGEHGQRLNIRCVTGISEGNSRISLQSAQLGALHRRSAEGCAEGVILESQNIDRQRACVLRFERFARLERILSQLLGESLVPRADVLTDVATIDEATHLLAQTDGNLSLCLDGEIGNAFGRIEHPLTYKSARWTGVETAGATAAAVSLERRVRRQRKIDHERADEKERSEVGTDQIGVLSEPAKSGASRQIALENGSGVDVGFSRD